MSLKDYLEKNLLKIILGSSFLFAILYFTGYLYLFFYFENYGALIPFSELPAGEIAIIGFLILFLLLLLDLIIYLITSLVLKKCLKRYWLINFIFFIMLLNLCCIKFCADKNFNSQSPFNSIYSLRHKKQMPLVKIIYDTPLMNPNDVIDWSLQGDASKKYDGVVTVEKYKDGGTKMESGEIFFYDNFGKGYYIANFILVFTGKNNYYLLPIENFFNNYGEIIAKNTTVNKEPIGDIKELIRIQNLHSLIIMPKNTIKSLQYIIGTGYNSYNDIFKGP